MEDENSKIKKFKDFMPKRGLRRMMSMIEVSGTIKSGFFSKKKKFEMQVYFTPLREKIYEITSDDINIDKLPFKTGDNIDVVRKWINENNHEIIVEINR
jgi:hypothetical protein